MRCTRAHEIVNRGFFITHLRSFGGAKNIAAALRTSMPAVTIPHPLVILRSQRLGPCKLSLYALLVFFWEIWVSQAWPRRVRAQCNETPTKDCEK